MCEISGQQLVMLLVGRGLNGLHTTLRETPCMHMYDDIPYRRIWASKVSRLVCFDILDVGNHQEIPTLVLSRILFWVEKLVFWLSKPATSSKVGSENIAWGFPEWLISRRSVFISKFLDFFVPPRQASFRVLCRRQETAPIQMHVQVPSCDRRWVWCLHGKYICVNGRSFLVE